MTCVRHLTVDEAQPPVMDDDHIYRRCVSCGHSYDRTSALDELRGQCLRRWPPLPPIPSSPWSAEERSYDPD